MKHNTQDDVRTCIHVTYIHICTYCIHTYIQDVNVYTQCTNTMYMHTCTYNSVLSIHTYMYNVHTGLYSDVHVYTQCIYCIHTYNSVLSIHTYIQDYSLIYMYMHNVYTAYIHITLFYLYIHITLFYLYIHTYRIIV